jgi:transcription elongation factor Elf1
MNDLDILFTQQKFAQELSSRLDKYTLKRASPFEAGFRCDVCGDSEKNPNKKRGGIIERELNLFYNCFNCGASHYFPEYLELYHYDLYQRYVFDVKLNKKISFKYDDYIEQNKPKPPVNVAFNPLKDLIKANENTFAKQYLKSRKIPEEAFDDLYYTRNFFAYINKIVPNKFGEHALKNDHPRIVIPMFDIMGTCFGVQGRSLEESTDFRYIICMFNKDEEPIFGLNTVNWDKPVYCTEGPLDSLFLDNAIAMSGSNNMKLDKNVIIILDNEPRSKQTVNKYNKYISKNYKICIWPKYIKSKDINKMIIDGYSKEDITKIIDDNIYQGTKAKIKLNSWKKVN